MDAVYDGDGNYVSGSILQYCVIEYAGGWIWNNSGAIRIEDSSPFIDHCAIRNNKSRGICIFNNSGPKITHNYIGDNSAYWAGGGIYVWWSGNIEISNNTIHNNSVSYDGISGYGYGGGIFVGDGNEIVNISQNTISNNTAVASKPNAGIKGVGIYVKNCTVDDNTIIGNQGGSGSMGGGIYSEDSEITRNLIDGNKAEKIGGIYFLGNNSIRENIITNNEASQSLCGGGAHIIGQPSFNWNDIYGNLNYDLYYSHPSDSLNATQNYWGSATTAEMESGGNLKNIGSIYDDFDNSSLGIVNYSNWLNDELLIFEYSPNNWGNNGVVTMTIWGWGFKPGVSVKLTRPGLQDISVSQISVFNSRKILATFDLTGRQLGTWNVVLSNPDAQTLILPGGFSIGEGYVNITLDIIGRNQMRRGRASKYKIIVSNHGNVIAHNNILELSLPDGAELVSFHEENKSYPLIEPDSLNLYGVEPVDLPVFILKIEPNESIVFELWIKLSNTVQKNNVRMQQHTGIFINYYSINSLDDLAYTIMWLRDPNYEWQGWETNLVLQESLYGIFIWSLTNSVTSLVGGALGIPPDWADAIEICYGVYEILRGNLQLLITDIAEKPIEFVFSIDPNEKVGPSGADTLYHYIQPDHNFDYYVYFENADSATAAAEEVLVIDTLDTDLDFSTYSIQEIVFGDTTITVPQPAQNYSDNIVLNDTTHVQITCSFDTLTGIAQWYLRGTDPRDGWYMGFLPPNVNSPEGEGHIAFTIEPNEGLTSGTQIKNRASIIFDVNPAMITNEVLNTIDAEEPGSQVQAFSDTSTSSSFTVYWAGSDDSSGSGIKDYSVYIAEDGGAYTPWQSFTIDTSGHFPAEGDHSYWFYSTSRDSVGNLEHQPNSPDLTVFNAGYNFSDQGWYLVSLPHEPLVDSLSTLFPSAQSAFLWDAQSQTYMDTTILDTTLGYWLAMPSATQNYVVGIPLNRYSRHFDVGWHLIGSVAQEVAFTNPNDNPDGAVIASFGWDPLAQEYYAATTFFPDHGYWIAVLQECELTIGEEIPLAKVLITENLDKKIEVFFRTYGSTPPPPPPFPTSTEEGANIPKVFKLLQNYPNPFNTETVIKYALPKEGLTKIHIYNIIGQRVTTLVDKVQPTGNHRVVWDGRTKSGISVASGIYFYKIDSGDFTAVKKMLLLK